MIQKRSSLKKRGNPYNTFAILLISLMIFLLTSSYAGAVSNVTINPDPAYAGDSISITGYSTDSDNADTGSDNMLITTSYEVNVDVDEEGQYTYVLEGIRIPNGTDTFTVKAWQVEDLEIEVEKASGNRILQFFVNALPYKPNAKAVDGVASLSQSNVPEWEYNITISGNAEAGEENVTILMKGTYWVNKDPETGYFSTSYATDNVPAGLFEIEMEDSTFEILLKEEETQDDNPGQSSSGGGGGTGTELNILSPEELAARNNGQSEGADSVNQNDEEEVFQAAPENETETQETPLAEQEEPQPGILQRIINWLQSIFG